MRSGCLCPLSFHQDGVIHRGGRGTGSRFPCSEPGRAYGIARLKRQPCTLFRPVLPQARVICPKPRSVEEAIKTAQDLRASPDLPIPVRPWLESRLFSRPRYLTKDDLDRITDTVPVMLHRTCGNVTTLNTSAIRALGITKDTVIPVATFCAMKTATATAFCWRRGQLGRRLLQESKEAIVDAAKRAAAYAVSKGLTSVQSKRMERSSDRMFQALHEVCPARALFASVRPAGRSSQIF